MSRPNGPRPDFLIIGAARCGTTSLTRALAAVPGVFIPSPLRPEPHFFLKSAEWARGFEWYGQHYFGAAPTGSVRGEKSSSYLCSAEAAARSADCLPGVRLVAMLRDPPVRAWSSWRFTRANDLEALGFRAALEAESERLAHPPDDFHREIRPHAYLERSRYGAQLETWLEHHPRDRLHVIVFERFVADPAGTLRALLEFLGVAPAGADGPEVTALLARAHNAAPAGDGGPASAPGPSRADRAWIDEALAGDRPAVERVLGAWPREWSAAQRSPAAGSGPSGASATADALR